VKTERPWWRLYAIVGGGVAAVALLIVMGLSQHRTRKVRFGSVMSVPLPPGDEPAIGAVLGGRYILGKPSGQEDAADLFEARDLEDRPRVLRRLRRTDTGILQRAKAASALSHPSILAVEAVFDHSGHVYLAAEPVAGEALRQAAGRLTDRRYAADAALRVVQAVCSALDYAQTQGVRHGHLTPAHVLVDRAKVLVKGFGLLPEASESDYLPPEQDPGNAPVEADVFCLGVCVYELLTGARPFTGPEAGQSKREGRYTPASKIVPTLGDGVDALLARALDPEPSRRFHAAGEFFAAYRNLVIPGVH
jgi:serine/threonine-protein kinase